MENLIAVYKIVNSNGVVEYVGQTKNIKQRTYQHFNRKPGTNHGLFYGRKDVIIEIIEYVRTRKEAFKIEAYWQNFYGFIPERKKTAIAKADRSDEEKLAEKIKSRNTVLSDPDKLKAAHKKRWETINSDQVKKEQTFKKMVESRDEEKRVEKLKAYIKNMDPEEKRKRYQKVWETRRLNKQLNKK